MIAHQISLKRNQMLIGKPSLKKNVFLVNFLNCVFLSPEELKRQRKVPDLVAGYDMIFIFEKCRVSFHSLILRHSKARIIHHFWVILSIL